MESKGFHKHYIDGQYVIDLLMPEELNSMFFARFYGKGEVCDGTGGEPEKIWGNLSYNYRNIKLVAPHQVHGTKVIPAEYTHALPLREDADGVFIGKGASCFGSLRFADCAPVVIAGAQPEPWLLLLHSGFAGTLKNITASGLEYVSAKCGATSAGAHTWAWVGPGICGNCYSRRRIGDQSTIKAMDIFSSENFKADGEFVFFDIRRQIFGQLMNCGLRPENIYLYDKCTFCGKEPLYSYRGGDSSDRIFLLAGYATKQ